MADGRPGRSWIYSEISSQPSILLGGLGKVRAHAGALAGDPGDDYDDEPEASILIAAGLNAKAVSVTMGHSSIAITFDIYGHLFDGSEAEAAGLVAAYLDSQQERAAEQARAAEPVPSSA